MKFGLPTIKVKSSVSGLLGKSKENSFLFQLQGRLGNQIWGLSDAYLLHKTLAKRVLLDLGDCQIDPENADFYSYVIRLPWLDATFLQFESSRRKTEIKELEIDDFRSPDRFIGYRGFSADYQCLKNSGLFPENVLPEFISSRIEAGTEKFISVSIRRGDYWQNPHLGILPRNYYNRALTLIHELERDLPFLLFGDHGVEKLITEFPKQFRTRVVATPKTKSPLQDLAKLSQASYSVIANSTFSFLGAYFSQSKMIVTPNPFYLALKGWNENLRNPRTHEISYLRAPKLRYLSLRIQKKLRAF